MSSNEKQQAKVGKVMGGYTEAQMLHVLHAQCEGVRLEKSGDEKWRLWCLCDGLGEFEMEGSLSDVLMHAFKPHKDKSSTPQAESSAPQIGG